MRKVVAKRLAGAVVQVLMVTLLAWQQYLIFLGHLASGNFGFSFVQQRPVSAILWPATRATGSLVFGAAIVWLLIAAPVGSYGGLRPRSAGDLVKRRYVFSRCWPRRSPEFRFCSASKRG